MPSAHRASGHTALGFVTGAASVGAAQRPLPRGGGCRQAPGLPASAPDPNPHAD